jgi:GT2 family glycosyltransferase
MPEKNSLSLTIVILNYNVRPLLVDCLNSLKKAKKRGDDWHIVVVDNKSTDDSVEYLKKHFPDVKLIANNKNSGFSAGNNIALREVNTPYTLLLNPDTVVYPNTIQTVLSYVHSHPEVGAATCRVELPDGSLDYSCHRRFPDPWNSFLYFFSGFFRRFSTYSDSSTGTKAHEIDSLTGAFALIRTKAGKSLQWLDEDYYWNGEDLDFCYRLKESNWKVVYLPQVKITHFKGSSSGLWSTGKFKINKSNKVRSVNAGVDAMQIFYTKHLESKYPALVNLIVRAGMFTLRYIRIAKVYFS